MVMTIKKGSDKKDIDSILKKLSTLKRSSKGFDAEKFCGVIKLDESPIDIQSKLRSEWD